MTRRAIGPAAWRWYSWGRGRLARVVRPILRVTVQTILRRDLTQPIPEATTDVPLETFIASRREVLDEVTTLIQPLDPSLSARFERYLDDGFVCFIARVHGQLVAYNWTQVKPGKDWFYYMDLRPDEIHCTDAYTAPDFRGRNIHAVLLREMLLFSAGLGYRYAYSGVALTNRRSPKAHRRLGWETTGRALLVHRGPVIRLWGSAHPWRRLRPGDSR